MQNDLLKQSKTRNKPHKCKEEGCENMTDRRSDCYQCNHNKTHYNINTPQRDQLLLSQNSCCAICLTPIEFKRAGKAVAKQGWTKSAAVDHCHKTGKVRGILCFRCNTTLGHIKESPDLLVKFIQYLEVIENEG